MDEESLHSVGENVKCSGIKEFRCQQSVFVGVLSPVAALAPICNRIVIYDQAVGKLPSPNQLLVNMSAPRAGRRSRQLLRTLAMILAAAAVYTVGRHAGQMSAAAAGGGGAAAGGGIGSARHVATAGQHTQQTVLAAGGKADELPAASLAGGLGSTDHAASSAAGQQLHQQQSASPLVDFAYDPMQQPSGVAAATHTPPPLRRPGFQAADNANQAKYDKMWTGNSSYQKGSCWGCRFVGDVATKLDFHTVLDAGTGEVAAGLIVWAARKSGRPAMQLHRCLITSPFLMCMPACPPLMTPTVSAHPPWCRQRRQRARDASARQGGLGHRAVAGGAGARCARPA